MMGNTLQTTLDNRLEELVREQANLAGASVTGAIPDEAVLVDLGLDSLGFVKIIVEMQRTFDVDPFGREDTISYPETVGELKELYRRYAAGDESHPSCSKTL